MDPHARRFTFLGTGTSVGVPMLGCDCAVCTSPDPRNHRYRCAAQTLDVYRRLCDVAVAPRLAG